MEKKGHTFGIVTAQQKDVLFENMRAQLVDPEGSENHPTTEGSPNYPRDPYRIPGFQNPILGDEGFGRIGRWHELKLEALENVVDQIIEQYLRDKTWYAKVRCREALWNMYRRIEWWVNQQVDPHKNQYQRVLLMIKDCIYSILDPDEEIVVRLRADFSEGLDESFTYSSGWKQEESYAVATIEGSGHETIRKTQLFSKDGYVLFHFSAHLSEGAEFYLKVNGQEVWKITDPTTEGDYTFRDFRYYVHAGSHSFEWGIRNRTGKSSLRFEDIQFVEFHPKDEETYGTYAGISIPYCPAPYYHHYSADHFNHFDGRELERKLFSTKDFPKLAKFPGIFRYVSSTEDQEWDLVYSTGSNELQGNENILKISLDKLIHGNSSKITFNWRFKRRGYIRFKYLASVPQGNGLLFFINGRQVGGEWNRETEWKEAKFNVEPGQTYKFDWLVRRMNEVEWGKNAVYIKDIECVEVIRTWEEPTPPDHSTLGSDAYRDARFEWITVSEDSVTRTMFEGPINNGIRRRTFIYDLHNECDGVFSFRYTLGTDEPVKEDYLDLFFEDRFLQRQQTAVTKRGSKAQSNHGSGWSLDGRRSYTRDDEAVVEYYVEVGDNAEVDITGTVRMECPKREVDHYIPVFYGDLQTLSFSYSGVNRWRRRWTNGYYALYMEDPIIQGYGDATTTVTLQEDGWFVFSFNHQLRDSEYFQVLVNGVSEHFSRGNQSRNNVRIRLRKGTNVITFRVVDSFTERSIQDKLNINFSYGKHTRGRSFSFYSTFDSRVTIRRDWEVSNAGTYTFDSGSKIVYDIRLNPKATFKLEEKVRLISGKPNESREPEDHDATLVFEELFNTPNAYSVATSGDWKWENIFLRYMSEEETEGRIDGVIAVDNSPGVHSVRVPAGVANGYVQFEYGGRFNEHQFLELYADGVLIWKDNESVESPTGKFVTVPLPYGTNQLEFRYVDPTGETIETGRDFDETILGEECVSGGNSRVDIDYRSSTSQQGTNAQSIIGWNYNGSGFISTPEYHGTAQHGTSIVREVVASKLADVTYRENLRVFAGTGINKPNLLPIPVQLTSSYGSSGRSLSLPKVNDYFVLKFVRESLPNSEQGVVRWSTQPFYSSGRIKIDLSYFAYLYGNSVGNGVALGNMQRATFNVVLYRVNHAFEEGGYLLLSETLNSGSGYKQDYRNLRSWGGAKKHVIDREVLPGEYVLALELHDEAFDSNSDETGLDYYTAFKLELSVTDLNREDPEYDDTYVLREVIDVGTGSVISSQMFRSTGAVASYNSYVNVPSGKTYQIKYTLHKGEGLRGGIQNNGGSFILSEGHFIEYWGDYCRDKIGNVYRRGQIPYTLHRGDKTYHTVLPADSWVWLDVIRVWALPGGACPGSYVHAIVTDSKGRVVFEETYSPVRWEVMNIQFTNEGEYPENYRLEITFHSGGYGDDYYEVVWTAVPGAVKYHLYRGYYRDLEAVTTKTYHVVDRGDVYWVEAINANGDVIGRTDFISG